MLTNHDRAIRRLHGRARIALVRLYATQPARGDRADQPIACSVENIDLVWRKVNQPLRLINAAIVIFVTIIVKIWAAVILKLWIHGESFLVTGRRHDTCAPLYVC